MWWVFNCQIKKGLLLSLRVIFFQIGEYLTKLQATAWLSHALSALGQHTAIKDEESARDNHVFACNFTKYLQIFKNSLHTEQ